MAMSVLVSSGCGIAFGSRGEAGRAESAFQQGDPDEAVAVGAPPSAVAPPSTSVADDEPITFPSIVEDGNVPDAVDPLGTPQDPQTELNLTPEQQALAEVQMRLGAMSADRVAFCTEATDLLAYSVGAFGDTGLPTRAAFLTLVRTVSADLTRVAGLDHRESGPGALSIVNAAAARISAAPDDQALAAAIAAAAPIWANYMVEAYAECMEEATGQPKNRGFNTPDVSTVLMILAN